MVTTRDWPSAPKDRPIHVRFSNGREEVAQWMNGGWKVMRASSRKWVNLGFDTPNEEPREWWPLDEVE
jgi:hypothetical protein